MTEVTDVLRDVVTNLNLKLDIYFVQIIGFRYRLFTQNTHYLNTNKVVTLNGINYTIIAFEQDLFIEVVDEVNVPAKGTYDLPAPFFIHGKLKPTNEELAMKFGSQYEWMPLVWMFELASRSQPAEIDSVLESEGAVSLFLMSSTNRGDFSTEDHYREVVKPMNSLADSIVKALNLYGPTGNVGLRERINHANFTTGGNSTTSEDEADVLSAGPLSGVEMSIDIPIKKKLLCPERFIPSGVGPAFDNEAFDDSFDT